MPRAGLRASTRASSRAASPEPTRSVSKKRAAPVKQEAKPTAKSASRKKSAPATATTKSTSVKRGKAKVATSNSRKRKAPEPSESEESSSSASKRGQTDKNFHAFVMFAQTKRYERGISRSEKELMEEWNKMSDTARMKWVSAADVMHANYLADPATDTISGSGESAVDLPSFNMTMMW